MDQDVRDIKDPLARIEASLTNRPPVGDAVVEVFELLRGSAKELAALVVKFVPASREQSLALTHLEETVMWAVKGVALNQRAVLEAAGIDVSDGPSDG